MTTELRADARRNRARIVAAASELFAEHGADVSVEEIARRADVGQATVFRRFPTKDDLVLAMFEQRIAEAADALEEIARTVNDPWEALASAMASVAERQARDRGMFEAGGPVLGAPELREVRGRFRDPLERMLRRAQGAGCVRDDLEPEDVIFLITAAGHAQPCQLRVPDLWRRYLAVILDGMRPAAASPLPGPAPTRSEIEAALGEASARARREDRP